MSEKIMDEYIKNNIRNIDSEKCSIIGGYCQLG